MKRVGAALIRAVASSVGAVSMYSLEVLPAPYNSIAFGGGAGLVAAAIASQAKIFNSKPAPIGLIGLLPGMPDKASGDTADHLGKPLERKRLLKSYDRVFGELTSRHGPDSRSATLERLRPIVYELSPEIKAWTGDARVRMYLLLQEIAKDLDDPSSAKANLELLFLILSKGGSSASEMARPMLQEKIQEMYRKPVYESERFLPRILLMLSDYDPEGLEKLTKDAIHVWGDAKFRAAWEYLGLEELKERGLRNKLKGILGREIAEAGNDRDATALNRAVELYHEVK